MELNEDNVIPWFPLTLELEDLIKVTLPCFHNLHKRPVHSQKKVFEETKLMTMKSMYCMHQIPGDNKSFRLVLCISKRISKEQT